MISDKNYLNLFSFHVALGRCTKELDFLTHIKGKPDMVASSGRR